LPVDDWLATDVFWVLQQQHITTYNDADDDGVHMKTNFENRMRF